MQDTEERKRYEQTEHPQEPRHSPEQYHSLKRQEYFSREGKGWLVGLNAPVAIITTLAVIIFLLLGSFRSETATDIFAKLRSEIQVKFKPWYVLLVSLIFIFVAWLGFGRYKNVCLGAQDEAPEFSLFSWFAMLFAAGMGIGLIFWGVAEPIQHFQNNPFIDKGGTTQAAIVALRLTFFHWGCMPGRSTPLSA